MLIIAMAKPPWVVTGSSAFSLYNVELLLCCPCARPAHSAELVAALSLDHTI